MTFDSERVESIVGEGENVDYQHILKFHTMFQKNPTQGNPDHCSYIL